MLAKTIDCHIRDIRTLENLYIYSVDWRAILNKEQTLKFLCTSQKVISSCRNFAEYRVQYMMKYQPYMIMSETNSMNIIMSTAIKNDDVVAMRNCAISASDVYVTLGIFSVRSWYAKSCKIIKHFRTYRGNGTDIKTHQSCRMEQCYGYLLSAGCGSIVRNIKFVSGSLVCFIALGDKIKNVENRLLKFVNWYLFITNRISFSDAHCEAIKEGFILLSEVSITKALELYEISYPLINEPIAEEIRLLLGT